MMIRSALSLAILVLCSALTVSAETKPIPCSLSVSPLRGESKTSKTGGNSRGRSSSSTKTVECSLKWKIEVRFREQKPEKIELKVHHLGLTDGGKTLDILQSDTPALEFDANGKAVIEVTSPKTRLTKTRSQSSGGRSSGSTSTKTATGEKVTGCVVQLFGDGVLLKAWTSDPRWKPLMKKDPFTLEDPSKKNDKDSDKK